MKFLNQRIRLFFIITLTMIGTGFLSIYCTVNKEITVTDITEADNWTGVIEVYYELHDYNLYPTSQHHVFTISKRQNAQAVIDFEFEVYEDEVKGGGKGFYSNDTFIEENEIDTTIFWYKIGNCEGDVNINITGRIIENQIYVLDFEYDGLLHSTITTNDGSGRIIETRDEKVTITPPEYKQLFGNMLPLGIEIKVLGNSLEYILTDESDTYIFQFIFRAKLVENGK